jgi:hypothetical protein
VPVQRVRRGRARFTRSAFSSHVTCCWLRAEHTTNGIDKSCQRALACRGVKRPALFRHPGCCVSVRLLISGIALPSGEILLEGWSLCGETATPETAAAGRVCATSGTVHATAGRRLAPSRRRAGVPFGILRVGRPPQPRRTGNRDGFGPKYRAY